MASWLMHTGSVRSSSSYWMKWGAIGYFSQSPLVCIDCTLNSARYDPWLYPLFESCETLRFSRIMHNHKLPVLYGTSLIRKIFEFELAYTFTRSFSNRKRLVYSCQATGSSPYSSHYS
ncbi:hypothetical protein TNCV_4425911 [Trichonephila clavipes]|nr:hypothetical protein TNCV_4425911 [Trichonephila clavipes]